MQEQHKTYDQLVMCYISLYLSSFITLLEAPNDHLE